MENFRKTFICYKCRGKSQHTSICQKNKKKPNNAINFGNSSNNNDQNGKSKKLSMLIDANTVALSQTRDETRSLEIKVLLDSGSQKVYISDEVGTKAFLRWFLSGPVTKRISDYSQTELFYVCI